MIPRLMQFRIEAVLFRGKAVIIYGARRVGKTTLIRALQDKFPAQSVYLNCDEPDVRTGLTGATSTALKLLAGSRKVIFIDEAQRVRNIGLTLKLLVDTFPEIQVVATGSSSLDLSGELAEPLTGRKYEFHLYPFALSELAVKHSALEIDRLLERRLIYGLYPEVEEKPAEAAGLLRVLASSYLYKDVLQYQDLRRPELLEKLLAALALQIGREVSFNELAGLLGVTKQTVRRYVQLLGQAFVIFQLAPFSRNLRSELSKLRKIYFVDNGIRNAVLNNFNGLHLRADTGQLWENFLISERRKCLAIRERSANAYFWRTHQQQEIDYLEEEGGRLNGFEIKWRAGKFRVPPIFLQTYAGSSVRLVTRENYQDFISIDG